MYLKFSVKTAKQLLIMIICIWWEKQKPPKFKNPFSPRWILHTFGAQHWVFKSRILLNFLQFYLFVCLFVCFCLFVCLFVFLFIYCIWQLSILCLFCVPFCVHFVSILCLFCVYFVSILCLFCVILYLFCVYLFICFVRLLFNSHEHSPLHPTFWKCLSVSFHQYLFISIPA